MPRQSEKLVYKFSELSDRAKEKAREWYRNGLAMSIEYDYLLDDFKACGKMLGIEIDPRTRRTVVEKGVMRTVASSTPAIYYDFSHGGACFEGSYAYVKGAAKAIRAHAPALDNEGKVQEMNQRLHKIADLFQDVQAKSFYRITADIRTRGRHTDEYGTAINVADAKDRDSEERIADGLRDFMRWMYRSLEQEQDFQFSNEIVDEGIEANEYEFYEDGSIS